MGRVTSAEVEGVVREILEDLADRHEEVSVESVQGMGPSTSLTEDLGFESLDLAELSVRIEDVYGMDVYEDQFVDTLAGIVTVVVEAQEQDEDDGD